MTGFELWSNISFFLIGAVVGSFLNVCIVRLPKEESVVLPRSHCVHCKKQLPWYDNIPFLSYLLLKGRCRFCGQTISFRYFLVEFLTAAAFVLFFQVFGWTPLLIPYLFMTGGFIVATFVDFEHRIIPDEVSIGGMFAGIAFSAFLPGMHDLMPETLSIGRIVMRILVAVCLLVYLLDFLRQKKPLPLEDLELLLVIIIFFSLDVVISFFSGWFPKFEAHLLSLDAALIGLLTAGGLIFAMGILGDFLFKKESMGGGDVKLMAMIGAFLGWKLAVLTFFLAPFFGAVYGIVEKIRTKDTAIAYGPFLAVGALISLFWGDRIIALILHNYRF